MFVPSTTHDVRTTFTSSEWRQPCRQFTCSEIQLATRNFDDSLIIGRGGFGKVYKGTITIGQNLFHVAIKRLDSTSNQGASEFWAEVNMLSNLRHCHLVSLIGYCNDGNEMILVYEYMSNGTLEDHLHKCRTPLSWVQRLTICIGAARGLDYLHTGTGIKHGVVHRDVKSSNILLHRSWEAKVADFGLSKICPKNRQTTYINTGVKGTFGYLDPDYFYTGKLTRKSDVYAFGVVLFEVLCGKRAVDNSIDEDQWGLAIWAQESIKEGRLKEIVDNDISEVISPKCLKKFAEVAKRCFHKNPKQRPTMAAVVFGLESILALQKKANDKLQPTREAPRVKFMSDKNTGDRSLNSLELYFDTVGGENQMFCRFDFEDINIVVNNFSEANKISQHTSDSWYKGKLPNGQSIAVVESFYGTGRREYSKNEASILVKLEHVNVVKLLGYCIEGTRLFFVYDFALHSILDHLMFGTHFHLKCTSQA
ncbi:putative serine/threonine-protein kinase PBL28 [Bidens hawaiensis]|uniref:putative serine/threonine-protein kinase PBL28 n=1 Tax=Bidens hawaiensis TaxID=980011 RepID=UPI00404B1E61